MTAFLAGLAMSYLVALGVPQGPISASNAQIPSSQSNGQNNLARRSALAKATPAANQAPLARAATIPAADPVITIPGLCHQRPMKASDGASSCATVITKGEFEALMNALNVDGKAIRPDAVRSFASAYAGLLMLADAANRAGLDKTAQYRRMMAWLRLRTLAELYRVTIDNKYKNPSQAQIDTFYHAHLNAFASVRLARILIPRSYLFAKDKGEFQKRAQKEAKIAHDRLLGGDEPEEVQKDVYSALHMPTPPPADMGLILRSQMTLREGAEVFSLGPGSISQIETESSSYVIYKVVSKETLPESQVKDAIAKEISKEEISRAMKTATGWTHPEFNPRYLGSMMALPGNPASAPQPGAQGGPTH